MTTTAKSYHILMNWILILIYTLLLASPIAEAVVYPGVTANKLGIEPYFLVGLAVLFSIAVRFFIKRKIWEPLGILAFYVLGPVMTIICLSLRYVELFTHPNYIFSSIGLSLNATEALALYSMAVSLPLLTKKYFSTYLHFTILALSIYCYHGILLTWSHPDLHIRIKKEDGLIEYLTFAAYLVAGVLSLLGTRFISQLKLTKNSKHLLTAFCVITALGLFLIAGEEISWGQRIANIEISESLAAANTQGELNLHNNKMIWSYVYKAYAILNIYGLVSWVIYHLGARKVSGVSKIILRLATSRWYLVLFFIPNLVYVSLMNRLPSGFDFHWEELTELYPAVGIMLWMLLNLGFLKKGKKSF